MSYKVVILGNCQASSWSQSLKMLNSDFEILHCEFAGSSFELSENITDLVKNSDFLVIVDPKMGSFQSNEFKELVSSTTAIRVPSLTCSVFHPDNGYIFSGERLIRNKLGGDWNSRILGFAYSNSLTFPAFETLFKDLDFHEEIGFFDLWEDFVDFNSKEFALHDLDFGSWLQRMRRQGVFMHGINHPKMTAILNMATQVLDNLQIKYDSNVISDKSFADPLNSSVWPIHPFTGDFLGIKPSRDVIIDGKVLQTSKFYSETWENWCLANEDGAKFSIWPPLRTASKLEGGQK